MTAASSYEQAQMDGWLTAIDADHASRSLQQKVLADKPAGLTDGCYLSASELISQNLTDPSGGQCGALYPVATNPRLVAGEGLPMTALKCSLAPLRFGDYPVAFTAAEKQRLRQAFPAGVCDYRRPGAGYRQPLASWLSYGDETTGLTKPRPLPPPPA